MIVQVTDMRQVENILGIDGLWEDMLEEGTEKHLADGNWYLAILSEKPKDLIGLAIAEWHGNNLIFWHFGLLKAFRGPGSAKYGKEVVARTKELLPNVRQVTFMPEYKEHAYKYAVSVGFKETYRIQGAIKKGGKLFDKILMEI